MRLSVRLAPIACAIALVLAGCAAGPAPRRPVVDTPAAFKEGQGSWVRAVPADALERGPWWDLFQDPDLNALASRVEVSNQNVAAAVAAYGQARTLVAQQRAALFPTVNLTAGASRAGGERTSGGPRTSYTLGIGGSWEPDVWGRLSHGVAAARAGEQASLADLQSAKLAAQGELATDYFNLRQLDAAHALQLQTIAGYTRSLRIAQNRYEAGVVARTDALQAQTQLANAQADLLTIERQRATLEHAIAVLVGQPPADFSLPPRPAWQAQVPDVPFGVPSTLLLRRPDIASAERAAAQASEQVGVAQAVLFPSLALNGSISSGAATVGDLFRASSLAWTLGASLAQAVFDAGARQAQVAQARARLEQAAARYRQTVLNAFEDVENQLVASRVLRDQVALRQEASRAADLVEQQVLNRYQAGQLSYTEVVTAQVTALNARRALSQSLADRQVAAVALIQGLGGGWRGLDATAVNR